MNSQEGDASPVNVKARLGFLGAILLTFCCYLFTMCPDIYWLDSGELVAASYSLGLAHSPSFPFFVMLTKPLTWLPVGDIHFRCNLSSILFGSLLIIAISRLYRSYLTSFNHEDSTTRTIIIALVVTLNPLIWFQCLKVEVYTLNLLLCILILSLAVELLDKTKRPTGFITASLIIFLFALALTNHSLLALHIAPALALTLIIHGVRTRFSHLAFWTLLMALGLSLYIYLPVRSSVNPSLDFGNPEHFTNFLNSLTRKGSFNRFFGNSALELIENLSVYNNILKAAFPGYLSLVILISGILSLAVRRLQSIVILIAILTNIMITLKNRNFNENPDTGPAYLMLSTSLLIISCGWLFEALLRKLKKRKKNKSMYFIAYASMLMIVIFMISVWMINNISSVSLSNDLSARFITESVMENCDHGSILFTGFYTNLRFVASCLQITDKFRTDIELIDRAEIVYWPGGFEKLYLSHPEWFSPEILTQDAEQVKYLIPRGARHSGRIGLDRAVEIITRYLAGLALMLSDARPVYWFPSEDDLLLGQNVRAEGLLLRVSRNPIHPGPDPSVWMRYTARTWMLEDAFKNSSGRSIVSDCLVNSGNSLAYVQRYQTAYLLYQSAVLVNPESSFARNKLRMIQQRSDVLH